MGNMFIERFDILGILVIKQFNIYIALKPQTEYLNRNIHINLHNKNYIDFMRVVHSHFLYSPTSRQTTFSLVSAFSSGSSLLQNSIPSRNLAPDEHTIHIYIYIYLLFHLAPHFIKPTPVEKRDPSDS